jgi:hypothetical protein
MEWLRPIVLVLALCFSRVAMLQVHVRVQAVGTRQPGEGERAMGFPQDIRSLESLNKLLDELEEEREREREEQEPPTSDEPADRGRVAAVETSVVMHAVQHLLDELLEQVFGQPLPTHPDERRALLEATWAREGRFIAAYMESKTPEELRAALIADDTLPAGYEWPAGYLEPFDT